MPAVLDGKILQHLVKKGERVSQDQKLYELLVKADGKPKVVE